MPINLDEDILEHIGVKGMKWGQRKTRKIQGRIDRINKVATGTASKGERTRVALTSGRYTQKSAGRGLRAGAALQKKVNDGDAVVTNLLLKVGRVNIKDLDYHQSG